MPGSALTDAKNDTNQTPAIAVKHLRINKMRVDTSINPSCETEKNNTRGSKAYQMLISTELTRRNGK